MKVHVFLASGLLAVLTLSFSSFGGPALAVGLGTAIDVERARANARAGGPVSEYDADLLRRYGCHSATSHPICDPRLKKPRKTQRPKTRIRR